MTNADFDHAQQQVEQIGRFSNVTQFCGAIKQPWGGFLPLKRFTENKFNDGYDFSSLEGENVYPALTGLAVDYLTRMKMGASFATAFFVSYQGILMAGESEKKFLDYENKFESSDEDQRIRIACHIVTYDACFRAGREHVGLREEPNDFSIRRIKIMVERSVSYLKSCGTPYIDGTSLLRFVDRKRPSRIKGGDCDGVAGNVLFDLKVSKSKPNSKETLQILTYYVWDFWQEDYSDFMKNLEFLAFFNPRLNTEWKISVSELGDVKEGLLALILL